MAGAGLVGSLVRGVALAPFKKGGGRGELVARRVVERGVRVDPWRLAAYEDVCGFAAGQGVLPVTYPHVLGFPAVMRVMSARDFPLPLPGLVHTSIDITRHRDTGVDEELELTVYAAKSEPHRRGTEVTMVTEARTGGALVWESGSTYLARHKVSGGAAPGAGGPGATAAAASAATPPPDALPAVAEWRLGGDLGRRYGAASGDRNPIHLYPLTARLFGFPRAIAHGMWTVARCLAEYGAEGPVRVRAEFRAPVLLPATVTYAQAPGGGTAFALRGSRGATGNGTGTGTASGTGERLHVTGEVLPLRG